MGDPERHEPEGYSPEMLAYRRVERRLVQEGDCSVYSGYRNAKGYGWARGVGRPDVTNRITWRALRGPIPDGLYVCHRCDNPPCCKLEHLFLGTPKDNLADAAAKKRTARMRGEKSGKAKLTTEQVRAIRQAALAGEKRSVIAQRFGISVDYVSAITRGRRRAYDGDVDGQTQVVRPPRKHEALYGPRKPTTQQSLASQRKEALEAFWDEAARLYESGVTQVEIARRFDLDSSTVSRGLRAQGVVTRPAPLGRPDVDRDRLRQLLRDGLPFSRIAGLMACSYLLVKREADALGIRPHPPGRPRR